MAKQYDGQEPKQLQNEDRVNKQDAKNLEKKEFFVDQLIKKGYEIISQNIYQTIKSEGHTVRISTLAVIVKKDNQLGFAKLFTGYKNPEWLICSSFKPLSLCGGKTHVKGVENHSK